VLRTDVALQATPLLRLVINLHRSRQPRGTRTHAGPTEERRLKKARIGQDIFREAVIDRWGGKCAVTECEIVPALEAAHIRWWSHKDTQAIRTSPENGLLLLRTLHSLFDLGLITFSDGGRMKISGYLDIQERKRLNIDGGMKLKQRLSTTQKRHMSFHRTHSFLDV